MKNVYVQTPKKHLFKKTFHLRFSRYQSSVVYYDLNQHNKNKYLEVTVAMVTG